MARRAVLKCCPKEEDPSLLSFCRARPFTHLFELCDLDPAYRSSASFHGFFEDDQPRELLLLWNGTRPSTLVGLVDGSHAHMATLLGWLEPRLPPTYMAHLSPGLDAVLKGPLIQNHGTFLRMGLRSPKRLKGWSEEGHEALGVAFSSEIMDFYNRCHPGHWFDPGSLSLAPCFVQRAQGRIVAAAGIHALSDHHGAAMLGNIVTDPAWRGRGLATIVTASLCEHLLNRVSWIGLNVRADNPAALACYHRLGFVETDRYDEIQVGS